MNAKTWVPLALAVVCAAGAAMVARQIIMNRPSADESAQNLLRTVVVANDNILPGTEIDPNMLMTAKVSAEMAQEDTFSDPGELAGRVAQAPIYKGQPLIGKLLAAKGSPGGIGTLIPPGMRAITIEVNEFTGVAGMLSPGCRVDVISTLQGDRTGEMLAQTVVQNIMVTAIGQRMTVQREGGRDEAPFRSVTLLATPEEAQAIELAASTGRPRLVLRNFRDESREAGPGVTLSDIRANNSGNRSRSTNPAFGGLLGGLFGVPGQTTNPTQSDPFATTPTESTEPVSTPVATSGSTPASEPENWVIKVIRAGTMTEVAVPLPSSKTGKRAPATPKRSLGLVGEPMTGSDAGDATPEK